MKIGMPLIAVTLVGVCQGHLTCHSVDPAVKDDWCDANCNHVPPECPASECKCDSGPTPPTPPTPKPAHPTPKPVQPTPPTKPTPSPPTPPPAPRPPPAGPGKRVVGYIESWSHYSHGLYKWTDEVANKLSHVNYAFATITYSKDKDVYYVDSADPWADMGDCMGAANCWQAAPDCLPIPGESCGGKTSPTVNLAPYIGAEGGTCHTGCINNGGSPISARNPPCNSNLNTFTHPSKPNMSSPDAAKPTACGLYNHLLNTKSGIKAKYPHIRWILSIGGWYDSNFFSAAASPKYRKSFVTSIVKYITAFGFDGVDFDWEYPGFEHGGEPLPGGDKKGDPEDILDCAKDTCQDPGRKDDGKNYAAFLTEVRAAFKAEAERTNRAESYIMSMAGPAGQDKLAKLDLTTMCEALDYVNVMTYDMHGSFDALTNHQSPLNCKPLPGQKFCYSVSNAIDAYTKGGCKSDQLNVGIPFYAHQYDAVPAGSDKSLPGLYQNHTGPDEGTCQRTPGSCVPTYEAEGKQWAADRHWDEESGAVYSYDKDGGNLYSYDDHQSIATKAKYIKSKGLGGFMYWYIGGDDESNTLLNLLYSGLN